MKSVPKCYFFSAGIKEQERERKGKIQKKKRSGNKNRNLFQLTHPHEDGEIKVLPYYTNTQPVYNKRKGGKPQNKNLIDPLCVKKP